MSDNLAVSKEVYSSRFLNIFSPWVKEEMDEMASLANSMPSGFFPYPVFLNPLSIFRFYDKSSHAFVQVRDQKVSEGMIGCLVDSVLLIPKFLLEKVNTPFVKFQNSSKALNRAVGLSQALRVAYEKRGYFTPIRNRQTCALSKASLLTYQLLEKERWFSSAGVLSTITGCVGFGLWFYGTYLSNSNTQGLGTVGIGLGLSSRLWIYLIEKNSTDRQKAREISRIVRPSTKIFRIVFLVAGVFENTLSYLVSFFMKGPGGRSNGDTSK